MRKSRKNITDQFLLNINILSHSSSHLRLFQIVAIPILCAMSWSRRYTIVGTTRMEKSVPTTVLSNVQEIRSDSVSVSLGFVTLGCRLRCDRQWRRPGWPTVWVGRFVYRRAFRGLADLSDHSSGLDRYANHRSNISKCRTRHDRRTVHRGGFQSTVSRICFRGTSKECPRGFEILAEYLVIVS